MTYSKDNVFAKIIRGELPCNKVYEDDDVLAFYDAYPQAKIHVLVIPKGPYIDYSDFLQKAAKEYVASFFAKVQYVIELLKLDSYRLISNSGEISAQSVFHFHLHILSGQKIDKLV